MSTLVPTLRLVLPDPTDYVHARAFDEIALVLVAALKRLGVNVELTRTCRQGRARVMVLAPHLQSLADLEALDRDALLYTWEPMGWSHVTFMTPELTSLMREFVIWDYSGNNVATWGSLGADRVVHVPLGYDAVLERLPPLRTEPGADVLFYGSVNERRKRILDSLIDRGLRVKWLFGVYGRERDAWISNSRLVINMHAHEGQILELPRLSYLWANRVPVVAEVNAGTEDALGMADVMLTAEYDDLPDLVVDVLADPECAENSAQRCYERFRGGPSMADVVRRAFVASRAPTAA